LSLISDYRAEIFDRLDLAVVLYVVSFKVIVAVRALIYLLFSSI